VFIPANCWSAVGWVFSNPREAFCARGCHTAFNRKRCLVCEGPMAPQNLLSETPRVLSFRLRQILANVAKFLRPFDQSPLPAFLFGGGRRLVAQTVDFPARHLGRFGRSFRAAPHHGLCVSSRESVVKQSADCLGARRPRRRLAGDPGVKRGHLGRLQTNLHRLAFAGGGRTAPFPWLHGFLGHGNRGITNASPGKGGISPPGLDLDQE
jgi:hypothetical protein